MGAVVSKSKTLKRELRSTQSFSKSSSQINVSSSSHLQQYIDDEENASPSFAGQGNILSNVISANNKQSTYHSSSVDQHSISFTLPSNWESNEFRYKMHLVLKSLFNGNVTPSVAPLLKKGARIIQIGNSSVPWIMDMAAQYPECDFLGIELISNNPLEGIPILNNVKFQINHFFQEAIEVEDQSVDYIHFRTVGNTIRTQQWPTVFKEINRILKPDGMIRFEDLDHSPTGSVMIESFVETMKSVLLKLDVDLDVSFKFNQVLEQNGYQVIEKQCKKLHYASDGELSKEMVTVLLNLFMVKGSIIGAELGLDHEDYRHRIETIISECVRQDTYMEWYSWVAKRK